jgi:hypothetical protein
VEEGDEVGGISVFLYFCNTSIRGRTMRGILEVNMKDIGGK